MNCCETKGKKIVRIDLTQLSTLVSLAFCLHTSNDTNLTIYYDSNFVIMNCARWCWRESKTISSYLLDQIFADADNTKINRFGVYAHGLGSPPLLKFNFWMNNENHIKSSYGVIHKLRTLKFGNFRPSHAKMYGENLKKNWNVRIVMINWRHYSAHNIIVMVRLVFFYVNTKTHKHCGHCIAFVSSHLTDIFIATE